MLRLARGRIDNPVPSYRPHRIGIVLIAGMLFHVAQGWPEGWDGLRCGSPARHKSYRNCLKPSQQLCPIGNALLLFVDDN
jgi:hypothetical protein